MRAPLFSLLGVVLLAGCPAAPSQPAAPTPEPAAAERPTAPDEGPQAPPPPSEPPSPPALDFTLEHAAPAPWAPGAYAPAFSFEGPDRLRVAVDPTTGEATLFELDGVFGSANVHRARTGARGAVGAFGRGWRAEHESRLEPSGEREWIVTRPAGRSRFVPLTDELFVSTRGDVEYLRVGPDREATLLDVHGRVLTFDPAGALTAVEPGYRIERAEGRVLLLGDQGALELRLDPGGRVVRARGGQVDVVYRYEGDELVGTTGTLSRRYQARGGRLVRAEVPGVVGGALLLDYGAGGRIRALSAGERCARYVFALAEGRIVRATCEGAAGRFEYALASLVWTVTTPRGTEHVELDRRGRVVAVTGADGVRRARRVNGLGRAVAAERGPVADPAVERDPRGRVLATASGVRRRYDALGRRVEQVDASGRATRFRYAAGGALAGAELPGGGGLRVLRDSNGRVVAAVTPAGRRYEVVRDAAGRIVAENGSAGPKRYERDALGRVVRWRDASGRELRLERTAAGQVSGLLAADGAFSRVTRDEDGALVLTSGDAEHQRRLVARTLAAGERGEAVRVEASATGEPTVAITTVRGPGLETVETPFGRITRRTDALGRVVAIDSPAGTFELAYGEDGRRARLVAPNGVATEVARDALGREVARRAQGPAGAVLRLEEPLGARGERTRRVHDGLELRLAHDAAGRLVRWQVEGRPAVRYELGEDGDRVREQRGEGAPVAWRYDGRGRLEQVGDEHLVYDGAGRLVERERAAGRVDCFRYDGFGRLVAVARAGRPEVVYGYDPLGRIATRTVAGRTTRFVYEGERLLAEVGPGARVRRYVYGPGLDEPLAYQDRAGERQSAWTYLHADRLGSVVAYSDEQGRRVDRALWAPYGELLVAPEAGRPRFYAGRWVDPIAAVVPMRARVYDPELGRFLTPDPAGLEGGLSAYAYSDGQPLAFTDPLGLWPWSDEAAGDEPPGVLESLVDRGWDTAVGSLEGLDYIIRDDTAAGDAARAPIEAWLEEKVTQAKQLGERLPTLLEQAGAAAAENAVGAAEGLGYLTGFYGDEASHAAAREHLANEAQTFAADVADTAQGSVEGLGYLVGAHGDAQSQAAARAASWRDVTDGGAQSRALGAVDGLGQSLILIDPGLSKHYAYDQLEAETGREYGKAGGVAMQLAGLGGAARVAYQARVAAAQAAKLAPEALAAGAKATARATRAAAARRALGKAAAAIPAAARRMKDALEKAWKAARKADVELPTPPAHPSEPARGLVGALEGRPATPRMGRPTRGAGRRPRADAPDGRDAARQGDELVDDAARGAAKTGCFLAGTLVPTARGPLPIEQVTTGDLVLSRDERSGQQGFKPVVRLFRGHAGTVVILEIAERLPARPRGRTERHRVGLPASEASEGPDSAQTLRCTTEHPFWVEGLGWTRAADLRPGDPLRGARGEALVVVSRTIRAEQADHFNFEVEGWHTYFVSERPGAPSVWVHNDCIDRLAKELLEGKDVRVKSIQEADEVLRRALPSARKVTGAGPGQGTPDWSKFKGKHPDGMYHKDYQVDPRTGRVFGHGPDNAHGAFKHINVKLPDGRKVTIIIEPRA